MSGEIFSNASDLANPLRWIGIASAVVDKIDYAASGGVANAESVVKAILAGASAVEVCSAVYLNTNAFIGEANRFLSAWMERKGFENIAQFKGKLNIKDEQGLPIHTSMSYGLSITYYKYPLYEAWKIAGNQLFGIAKDKERHGGLKNAIAWKIQKHSGSTYEGSFSKSEAGLYDAFTHILYTLSKDRLVSAVAHKIRSNENLLALLNTEDNDMLAVRIKAFFDHVVDIEDKTPATIQYIQQVKTLLMQLYQSLHEQKIKDIPALISCAYGMLRTAKFINGEEERI